MPDLITLQTLTQFMPGIGAPNPATTAALQFLISVTSADFLRAIRRPDFLTNTYTEIRIGDGGNSLTMHHWPITQVSSVTIGQASTSQASTPTTATVIPISDGEETYGITVKDGQLVVGSLAAQSATVTASSPIAGWYVDVSADPERCRQIYLTAGEFTDGALIQVQYVAGYAVAPEDVQGAVAEWAAARYQQRSALGTTKIQASDRESVDTAQLAMPANTQRVIDAYLKKVPSLERKADQSAQPSQAAARK